MKHVWILGLVLLAGCAAPSEPNAASTSVGPTSEAPTTEATSETAAATISTGQSSSATTGPTAGNENGADAGFSVGEVTHEANATFYLNTTTAVNLILRHGSSEIFRGPVPTSKTWEIALEYGPNEIQADVAGPGITLNRNFQTTRLGLTLLTIDYSAFHPDSAQPKSDDYEVWIDVTARPSAGLYEANGIQHVDAFNAHDQLFVFTVQTAIEVVYEYFASFQGFGVSYIDGAGNPISTDAPPYWCYKVNGASADGISIQPIVPGDEVVWTLGTCT